MTLRSYLHRKKSAFKDLESLFKTKTYVYIFVQIKVQQFLYTPGQALRVPEDLGSQMSRQLAHKCGKAVSPTHRPPLPPENIPGTRFY
jgi:hypothetical protein